MITVRCTQKLRKLLGIEVTDPLEPTTAKLGDWYANLVPTHAGELIVFINEKSLLVVAVPVWEADKLLPLFIVRVANLLGMIGVGPLEAAEELIHFNQVQFGKTASRRVLGSLTDFAWNIQVFSEDALEGKPMSLSEAELSLSAYPCKPIGYKSPAKAALELLMGGGKLQPGNRRPGGGASN